VTQPILIYWSLILLFKYKPSAPTAHNDKQ
jgi:hypothetical protein